MVETNHIPTIRLVEGTTVKLQKLTGENDRLNSQYPANNTQSRFGVLGTDLGTPVEYNGKLYFLFGDTFLGRKRPITNTHDDTIPEKLLPYPHFLGEDSIAWTITRDPEQQKVNLDFVSRTDPHDQSKTYIPPEIYKDGRPLFSGLGFLQVPTGGFSANGKLYAIYTLKNNDNEKCFKTPDGKNCYDFNRIFLATKKDNLSVLGDAPVLAKEADANWNPKDNGKVFNIFNWEIMWKSFLVSTDCLDDQRCINDNTIKFNFVYELSNIYNKAKDSLTYALPQPDDPYKKLLILDLDNFPDFNSIGKFIHVSAVVVDNSRIPDLPDSSGQGLLLWGIGLFRRSNSYLAYIPLSGVDKKENIRYYGGRQEGSSPHKIVWGDQEKDACPLFDHPVIGEFNVTWNPILKLWIMLYNNDTDNTLMRKAVFIQFRTALWPWGPWSEPRILFDPNIGADDDECNIIYYEWKESCRRKDFKDADMRTPDNPYGKELGSPYAPFVIPRFTKRKGKNSLIYYVMSTWFPYNTVIMRSEITKPSSDANVKYSGNPVLIQSSFGTNRNFEVVSCFRTEGRKKGKEELPFGGGGLVHFSRNHDNANLPWSNFTQANPFPFPPNQECPPATFDDFRFPIFEEITFIQSNFGSDNFDKPANFEVIGRVGDRLKHVWRESKYPFYWRNTRTYLQINNSDDLTRVTGNPCLIQSSFGSRHMNFELVVPRRRGGIYHIYKVHDGDHPERAPWQIGSTLDSNRRYQAVSLIQSDYARPENPGNLELVARTDDDKLVFFWMYSGNPTKWNGPYPILVDGRQIAGVTGVPSLIQSTFGNRQRNFQLVVPLITGGFMHYVRDNDVPDGQEPKWHIENEGRPIDPTRRYEALSLIQSNFRHPNLPGNLEVAALSSDGLLFHFWMDSETKRWDGPYDFASF